MTREQLNDFIDERIYPNSENEITAAKHNAVDKALADYAEDYADAQIASEVGNRNTAISAAISGEVSDRDSAIASAIASEVSARNSSINAAISQEVSDRNTAIGTAISTEVSERNAAIDAAVLAARNARYTAFGATYDNGTWTMHGGLVTGITAAEMEVICAGADFNCGSDFMGALARGKTNRPLNTYRVVRGDALPVNFHELAHGNTALEVFYSPYQNDQFMLCVSTLQYAFITCSNLRIVKYLDVTNCNNFGTYSPQTQTISSAFGGCAKLEELYMRGIGDFTTPIAPATDTNNYPTLDLKDCAVLTKASALYLINNAVNQNRICIRFSSSVSWAGDAEVIAACAATETHAQIVLEFM